MQWYREPWVYGLSIVLMLILATFYSNNVLAQLTSSTNDHPFLIPSDELIDDDIEMIEEMIDRQKEVKEEPKEIGTKSPAAVNDDNDDSNVIAAIDDDNEVENDRGSNGYSFPSGNTNEDSDVVVTKKEKPITDEKKKVASNNAAGSEVYVVDYMNIRIQKFTNDGSFISKWGSEGKGEGEFGVPHGIEVDSSSGHVYVVDMANYLQSQ